jgi:hypothetical protein
LILLKNTRESRRIMRIYLTRSGPYRVTSMDVTEFDARELTLAVKAWEGMGLDIGIQFVTEATA